MALFRIIFFLLLFSPAMILLSGCYDDAFLEAMNEEVDFIAPFDVVLSLNNTKRTVYFPIPDSGSTKFIKNGDDSTYIDVPDAIQLVADNSPNGTSDPVVIDNVTGLTWTKCSAKALGVDSGSSSIPNANPMDITTGCTESPVVMEWTNAVSTCKALNKFYDLKKADGTPGTDGIYETGYGGYNDWRLPRLSELLSIVNFDFIPAIDPGFFPLTKGAVDEGYWTYTSKLFIGDNDTTIDYGWLVFFWWWRFLWQ